jgi:hypothetical protein
VNGNVSDRVTKKDPEFRTFDNYHDEESFAECFFRWIEHYHDLEANWDKANSERILAGSIHEFDPKLNKPYSEFRAIAKRRLIVMLNDSQRKLNKKK